MRGLIILYTSTFATGSHKYSCVHTYIPTIATHIHATTRSDLHLLGPSSSVNKTFANGKTKQENILRCTDFSPLASERLFDGTAYGASGCIVLCWIYYILAYSLTSCLLHSDGLFGILSLLLYSMFVTFTSNDASR